VIAQSSSSDGSGASLLFLLIVFGGFFLFMSWRQRRRVRERKEFIGALAVGDTVRSIGGIIGVIKSLDEDEAVLDVEGTRLRFQRGAIAEKVTKE
jgi:preprotein translocase subunit YajC